MPHKRSNSRRHVRFERFGTVKALNNQKKLVRQELEKATVYDRETKEKICQVEAIELAWNSKQPCVTPIVPNVVQGEVLCDSRGRGTLDQDVYIDQLGKGI